MSNPFPTNYRRIHKKNTPVVQKIFEPFIGVEQILSFDPKNPATHTESRLMNAVLEAFTVVEPILSQAISQYLGLDNLKLTHAIEIISGHSLTEIIDIYKFEKMGRLRAEHPDWSSDQIAQGLGMYDRSTLWRFEQKMNAKIKKQNNKTITR